MIIDKWPALNLKCYTTKVVTGGMGMLVSVWKRCCNM